MKFRYSARDARGGLTSGQIEAPTESQAREMLRRKSLFVQEIREDNTEGKKPEKRGGRRASSQRVSMVLRQLAALLNAGSPIVDALSAMESQVQDAKWKSVLGSISRYVQEGHPLSEAMSHHPSCFDGVCRSMVAAGESSGKLPELLDRYSRLLRQEAQVRRSVIGSMMYPVIVLMTGIVMLVGMVIFVLPKFQELFVSLDAPLPAGTAAAMWFSEMLSSYWWGVLGALGVLFFTTRWWLRTARGRRAVDRAIVNAPQLGPLTRSLVTARISRLLGTLLQSHLPILEVLELSRNATRISLYQDLLIKAEGAVSRGETVSSVLSHSDLITPSVREVLRTGESTGRLGQLMTQMAETLDEDNEIMLKTLMSVLEPVMLLLIGVLVAGLALIVYLPLFDIATTAGAH